MVTSHPINQASRWHCRRIYTSGRVQWQCQPSSPSCHLHLGRKELLAPSPRVAAPPARRGKSKAANREAAAVGAWDWGVMLVTRQFRQQLGVEEIIDSEAKQRGTGRELAERALVLVTNRLCEPGSEQNLARPLLPLCLLGKANSYGGECVPLRAVGCNSRPKRLAKATSK